MYRCLLILLSFFVPVSMYRYIIIPGLGGSVLYNSKSHKVWPAGLVEELNPTDLGVTPGQVPDVFSTLRSIGDLESIKIDTHTTYFFTKNIYYSTMIEYLQKRNHNVMALPYDFRHILHKDYYTQLYEEYKCFIEKDYENTGEPIVFIAHSAGGLVLQHFIHSFLKPEWVRKHISKIYYVSVPFGGCPDSLYFLIDAMSHSNQNMNIFKMLTFVPNFHLCSGFYLCLPLTNDPILRKNGKWLYKNHIPSLFSHDKHALDVYQAAKEYSNVRKKSIDIPQVVIHGSGMNTTIFHDYDNHLPLKADGDSMVSTSSLLYPKKYWKIQPSFVELRSKEHSRINNYYPMLHMISTNQSAINYTNIYK